MELRDGRAGLHGNSKRPFLPQMRQRYGAIFLGGDGIEPPMKHLGWRAVTQAPARGGVQATGKLVQAVCRQLLRRHIRGQVRRSRPLAFSTAPFCQGLRGSQK